tara:strand:+ start:2100 stop:2441 length:342 start_codon:yes stop_codon:yes gene_type:complete
MSVTITGKIKKILPIESGISKAGKEWQKQSVVIEQNTEYNKDVVINAFGQDKIKNLNKFSEGDTIDIMCNVYSREFNGKYYTSLDGYWFSNKNVERFEPDAEFVTSDKDDLPF